MRGLVVAAVLTALAVCPTAAAQNSKLEPPDLARYLRWGPVRARPGLNLQNLGYDDNILRNPSNRVSDYTATVVPRLDGLVLFGERAFLTFAARVSYTGYVENTDQSFLNYRTGGRLTVPFGRIGVFADLEVANEKQRPIDLEDIRPERDERAVGGGVILGLGWRSEIEVGYRSTGFAYDDPEPGSTLAQRLDRNEEGSRVAVSYLVKGRTRATFDFERDDVLFDRRPDRDARAVRLLPGLELGRGGPLTGAVRVGWAEIDALDPAVRPFSGVVGDAALDYRLGGGLRLEFEFERNQDFSFAEDTRYVRVTETQLRAVRYLNRILGVEGTLGRGWLSFQEGPGADREDDILRYSVGVRFRLDENSIGRKVEYSLVLRRYERQSTIPDFDNDATSFGLNAVVGF